MRDILEYDAESLLMDWKGDELVNLGGAQEVLVQVALCKKLEGLGLSHNLLRDVGVAKLLEGMMELKRAGHDIALGYLNLSSNKLTNASLSLICQHLLDPASVISKLEELHLSGNSFDATGKDWEAVCAELGTITQSSSLQLLILNSNARISSNIHPLLKALRLDHSRLFSLSLATCGLNPDASIVLAEWLEDPEGAGRSLQTLNLKGNNLSIPGVWRIEAALISGKCTGLVALQTGSNNFDISPKWRDTVKYLQLLNKGKDPRVQDDLFWESCCRNMNVTEITRTAALRHLCQARILFSGNPITAFELFHDEKVFECVVSTDLAAPSTHSPREEPPSNLPAHFPFLQLPLELQFQIFSLTFLVGSSSQVFECAKKNGHLPTLSGSELAPALTESQISKVLAYAMDRGTLAMERSKEDVLLSMDCHRFQRG